MTYSLKLEGFQTKEQAQALLDWYEGQGEQQAGDWFGHQDINVTFMPVNCHVPYKWENDTLVAQLSIYVEEE